MTAELIAFGERVALWVTGGLGPGAPAMIGIQAHGPSQRDSSDVVRLHTFAAINPEGDYVSVTVQSKHPAYDIPKDVQRSVIENFVVPPEEEEYQRQMLARLDISLDNAEQALLLAARMSTEPLGLPLGLFAFGHAERTKKLVAFLYVVLCVPYETVLAQIRTALPPVGS